MKKLLGITTVIAFLPVMLFADLVNITVHDGKYSGTGWWGYHEDNEVEPNCVPDQNWDLEGFFLDDNSNELTMVGGYDFEKGYGGFSPGDIFIDADPDQNNGYDFVVQLDFGSDSENPSYTVYALDENSDLEDVYYGQNAGSNPWKCNVTDEDVVAEGNFSFTTVSGDNIYNVKGDADDDGHYVVGGIDLSFLGTAEFEVHYTMECGNDNLMGSGAISVPEPGTFSLLAMGSLCLFGFWALRRKKEE